MLVWWLVVAAAASSSAARESRAVDENTKLVIFGSRHGNRHPGRFLNENPRIWGFEGDYELTQFGKRQGFGFGKELREFVGALVSNNYVRHEASFYTSSANRCQMTLQVIMAGFYPPDTFAEWNHALEWSPVPYTIDDPMLRMYSVKNCTTSQQAWQPINDDNLPELLHITEANAQLLDYISKHTGWNASIESATDLADNIAEIRLEHVLSCSKSSQFKIALFTLQDLYNSSLPEWIEHPKLAGFDKQALKQAIMSFVEKHTLTCVDYEPCRDIMGGTWLQHILSTLRKAASNQQTQKLLGYVSHLEVTLSVMRLMMMNQSSLDTSAGFLIEYRDKPAPSVRLLYHEPLAIDRHTIKQANYLEQLEKLSDSNYWIPFDKFDELVRNKAIVDWESACRRKPPDCTLLHDAGGGAAKNANIEHNRTTSGTAVLRSSNIRFTALFALILLTAAKT
ncbi:unnamed protein product [Gongylonema pulchrum]|uniref:Lysosomal acid phosphatase n=1 Tax=Gongylonema pulchrum TaxID=637853 RepID=A0A183EGR9_9BILA|nr:unnamed protein product [Gongylonema pulchrum]